MSVKTNGIGVTLMASLLSGAVLAAAVGDLRLVEAAKNRDKAAVRALLDKRVFMEPGSNTTYVQWRVRRARAPLTLEAAVLVDYRDYHGATRTAEGFAAWTGEWVTGVRDRTAYLRKLGPRWEALRESGTPAAEARF